MTRRLVYFLAFLACVVGANLALARWGIVTVAPGLQAPAGVWLAGLTFGVRDALHESGRTDWEGRLWALAAIVVGAALSWRLEADATIPGGLAPIAVASGAAFLFGELADLAVYDRVRRRNWLSAVALSNTAGAVADSALFLWLAFGNLAHVQGNVVGKLLMVAPAVLIVWRARAVPRYRLG